VLLCFWKGAFFLIGERIKKLRKGLDLTQQEFSERIGIKRNTIAKYETGRGEPIDAVISLMCREFNVNETWLRAGEGEMFNSAQETELDILAKKYRLSDIGRALIAAYIQLNETDRASVDRYVRLLASGGFPLNAPTPAHPAAPAPERPAKAKPPVWQAPEEWTAADIDAEAERYRQQLLSEQERAKQVSSAKESGAG